MQPNQNEPQSKMSRALSDIVIAEMFLLQATLESASAISDGIADLSKQIYWSEDDTPPQEPIKAVLQRTRDEVVESYTSRFDYLRNLMNSDS